MSSLRSMTALACLTVFAACESPVANEAPSDVLLAAVMAPDRSPQFFPFTFIDVAICTELVDVSGYFHPNFKFTTDANGGTHFKGHFNATGIGVGQTTGAIYNWNDAINFGGTFVGPQETFTNTQALELIGRGQGEKWRGHVLFHVTVNANGVVKITADNVRITCS